MKIPAIKRMVAKYSIDELKLAEHAILDGKEPAVEIEGDDEGEQLTHAIAAREVLQSMEKEGLSSAKALRKYSQRVRNSIS